MKVQVLGTGCQKCEYLEQRVKKVATENGIDIEYEKVSDVNDILSFGIMMTPGLVVDGDVKSSGKIPSEQQILEWIQ